MHLVDVMTTVSITYASLILLTARRGTLLDSDLLKYDHELWRHTGGHAIRQSILPPGREAIRPACRIN